MFKKIFNLINKKKNIENTELEENFVGIDAREETTIKDNDKNNQEIENIDLVHEEIIEFDNKDVSIEKELEIFLKENEGYIKDIKIRREKSIRSIDIYNEEILEFKSYKECSKTLKIPLAYIKENLKYGHTDYLGDAINYLKQELGEYIEDESEYLNNTKSPIELFNMLNNKIFKCKISENKRDEILSSEKIEPVKMHYRFECIDTEYDDYFKKYGAIIKRGGNKKIELVNKKGEVVEIFKSLDSCSNHLSKNRNEIVDMLKCGNTKVGRYEIRYSLRSI